MAMDLLVAALAEDLGADPTGPRVRALLRDYARRHTDWRRYALFNDAPGARDYARNLVERNHLFELLVLCWEPHQESPVHNHEGQHCWMAVLDGAIEEVYFEHPQGAGRPLRQKGDPVRYQRGAAGYIHDRIALHLIRPAGGRRAVSLHLYARPFDACNIYDPQTGRITRKRLGYFSIRGERVAESAPPS